MGKNIKTNLIEYLGDYILINGKKYSTKNTNNDYIAKDIDGIMNFYKWFGESKTLLNHKPIVYYHISNHIFNEFKPSIFGKMGKGIYFTSIYDDLKTYHNNRYEGGTIYECYLKIENPLEIENPFSKRNDDNDGVIALKGQEGEEIKVYQSNQIKSVENDGSFDIDDNNIYS